MKYLKRITILLLIIISTGCSVEYNLTINEDGSISEKVVAKEKTKKMESITRTKGDDAVAYLYNMFKRDNENINLNTNTDSNNTYATATTSHTNIQEYASKFKSDVFKKVNIEKKDNLVTFTANQTIPLNSNSNYSLIYDDIIVNIYIPFKVSENNADQVNGNNYIWKIKKDEKLKNIKIVYDEGSRKNNVNININNKTYNISYAIVALSGIILVITILILLVVIKNRKNNLI